MKNNKIYGLILLLTYSISIIPSFIFHQHNESHNHCASFHCESISKYSEDHIECVDDAVDCTHDNHFNQTEECFLCDNYSIYEYVLDSHEKLYNDKIFISKISSFYERLYLKAYHHCHNKSPPVLIYI